MALGDITIEHYPGSGDKQELSDAQDMLDRLVRAAKNRGANGIIGYTCDLTMTKYGPSKWIASGVAVHFDKLPNIPKTPSDENSERGGGNPAGAKEEIMNFAQRTVDYLIETDTKFIIWSFARGDLYFDLNQKKHILQEEFDAKYGPNMGYTIDMLYRDAKKADRKASKNQ